MSQHPDIVELDALRLGHGRAEDAAHVGGCRECGEILADLQALGDSLKTIAQAPPIQVPAERERLILWGAHKRALVARRRPWWRRSAWAAAALVLIGLGSMLRLSAVQLTRNAEVAMKSEAARPRALASAVSELEGKRGVDILDAFALARAVENHNGGIDVNRDGVVDERDVEALAAQAVSLRGA